MIVLRTPRRLSVARGIPHLGRRVVVGRRVRVAFSRVDDRHAGGLLRHRRFLRDGDRNRLDLVGRPVRRSPLLAGVAVVPGRVVCDVERRPLGDTFQTDTCEIIRGARIQRRSRRTGGLRCRRDGTRGHRRATRNRAGTANSFDRRVHAAGTGCVGWCGDPCVGGRRASLPPASGCWTNRPASGRSSASARFYSRRR